MSDEIRAILNEVSETMLDDGVELVLESVDSRVVRVRIAVNYAVCDECVVPTETIERILLQHLRSSVPELGSVEVSEPASPSA